MTIYSLLLITSIALICTFATDIPCQWDSKTGASFNLQPLTAVSSTQLSYQLTDGDIPCTPEIEPSYVYSWNFCADVTTSSLTPACSKSGITSGVVLQSYYYGDQPGKYGCYVIGTYDKSKDDSSFKLLDQQDPSFGVSITYTKGELCSAASNSPNTKVYRSATIEVQCANVKSVIVSANEPHLCEYHLIMKSYYGCPKECPITSNGLCDGHGYCKYDKLLKQPYCYCNSGRYGSSCSSTSANSHAMTSGTGTYDGRSVQMGLLITLLILTIGLLGVVGYMVFRITDFRKQQVDEYASLSGTGTELVDNTNF